jgi:hypothetical protein
MPFFGQNCSLLFSLTSPWYPCPFEILAETLKESDVIWDPVNMSGDHRLWCGCNSIDNRIHFCCGLAQINYWPVLNWDWSQYWQQKATRGVSLLSRNFITAGEERLSMENWSRVLSKFFQEACGFVWESVHSFFNFYSSASNYSSTFCAGSFMVYVWCRQWHRMHRERILHLCDFFIIKKPFIGDETKWNHCGKRTSILDY